MSIGPADMNPAGFRLVRQLRRQVLSGRLRPGMRLPSVRKLAQSGNIGIHAANQALQRIEREGWASRQNGGYILRIAEDAAERATGQLAHEPPVVIVMVSPALIRDADASLTEPIVEGICEVFPGCSFRNIYVDLRSWLAPVKQLLEQDADMSREIGFLLRRMPTEVQHFFSVSNYPCVVAGYGDPSFRLPCVFQDMVEVGRTAGRILCPAGRLVALCHEDLVGAEVRLLEGVRNAAEELGCPPPSPSDFYHHLPRSVDDYLNAIHRLLSRDSRPAGIIGLRPEFAMATAKIASQLRIQIPHELQVIGLHDHPMYRFVHPEITSITVPSYVELGRRCAVLLADAMGELPSERCEEVIPSVLVQRGSTLAADRRNERSRIA